MGNVIALGLKSVIQAKEYFLDFIRQNPNTRGAKIFATYTNKLDWIHRDLLTIPQLPQEVRDSIRQEINADHFCTDSILEKVVLLNPAARESIDTLIDCLLNGETIEVVKK